MLDQLAALTQRSKRLEEVYQAELYRLNSPEDRSRLEPLLRDTPGIEVWDEMMNQLEELIASRNPSRKFTRDELQAAVSDHLGNSPTEEYGVWVYYPWRNSLVHLLDESEFAELRTNRNQNKITKEECAALATKKVGIVGLSVGQSVALSLSLERSFGELRIADYDELELSNLNRIRTGTYHLGTRKVVIVAREIAEQDPFLKVKIYRDGLTEDNIESFFTEGGKLDCIVDECDGLDVKILLRQHAKRLQVPVLMEMNDRCTVDVERFDLEPERPLLHGLVGHLNPEQLKGLTNEEKIPYIMPMLGEQTISLRLKASMLEIEESIKTWPQLGSSVMIGGGVVANLYRRMMLGEFTASGRWFMDLDQIFTNTEPTLPEVRYPQGTFGQETLNIEALRALASRFPKRVSHTLNTEQAEALIQAAHLAPSAGNSQPWQMLWQDNTLFLILDRERANSYADYKYMASLQALGAAAYNVEVKAAQMGFGTSIDLSEIDSAEPMVAIHFDQSPEADHRLAPFIAERATSRAVSAYQPLEKETLGQLAETRSFNENVQLTIVEAPEQLQVLGEIIGEADRQRFFHPAGHADFFKMEARWNAESAESTKDGIDLRTVDMKPSAVAGMKIASDYKVVEKLKSWNGGHAFGKMAREAMEGASAFAIFSVRDFTSESLFEVGRTIEHFWLHAARLNVGMHPLLTPAFFWARMQFGACEDFSAEMLTSLRGIKKQFNQEFPAIADETPVFLVKLTHGHTPAVRSLRRDISDVAAL